MENLEIYNSIAEDYTGMSWIELIEDIGLEESDIEEFAFNFAKSLQGKDKTPSEEKNNKTSYVLHMIVIWNKCMHFIVQDMKILHLKIFWI